MRTIPITNRDITEGGCRATLVSNLYVHEKEGHVWGELTRATKFGNCRPNVETFSIEDIEHAKDIVKTLTETIEAHEKRTANIAGGQGRNAV